MHSRLTSGGANQSILCLLFGSTHNYKQFSTEIKQTKHHLTTIKLMLKIILYDTIEKCKPSVQTDIQFANHDPNATTNIQNDF